MAEDAPSIRLSLSRWFAIQTLVGLSIACAAIYATTRWSFQVKQAEEFARYHDLVRHVVEENRLPPNVDSLRHKMGDFFDNHENVAVDLRAGQEALYASAKVLGARAVERRAFILPDLPFREQLVTLRIELDVVDDDRLLTRLAWTLFAVATVGTAIVALTGFFLVRRGLKPLAILAEQTAAVDPRTPLFKELIMTTRTVLSLVSAATVLVAGALPLSAAATGAFHPTSDEAGAVFHADHASSRSRGDVSSELNQAMKHRSWSTSISRGAPWPVTSAEAPKTRDQVKAEFAAAMKMPAWSSVSRGAPWPSVSVVPVTR